MRIALVDLGSASLRAEVYEIREKTRIISRLREMPRLGQGLYCRGTLPEEGKVLTLELFRHLNSHFSELEVDVVHAVATSAIREAADGIEFIDKLQAEAAWPIRILSGLEEARLIARGIIENEADLPETALFVDIGGGSTELSIYSDGEILAFDSLKLGAIRYSSKYLDNAPPELSSLTSLSEQIKEVLQENDKLSSFCGKINTAIGSSGTARAVTALVDQEKESLKPCTADDVHNLRNRLSQLTFAQIDQLPGMQKNRSDIMLAGAMILDLCLNHFGIQNFRASRYSLRHGLLAEALKKA
jgi:exopolyphosphatase/guanosine-5'-triphosphate,3'-diphosphate pyrophosphatase